MRKKSVRLVSAALAVCMMLSAMPMGAFAAKQGGERGEHAGRRGKAVEGWRCTWE